MKRALLMLALMVLLAPTVVFGQPNLEGKWRMISEAGYFVDYEEGVVVQKRLLLPEWIKFGPVESATHKCQFYSDEEFRYPIGDDGACIAYLNSWAENHFSFVFDDPKYGLFLRGNLMCSQYIHKCGGYVTGWPKWIAIDSGSWFADMVSGGRIIIRKLPD